MATNRTSTANGTHVAPEKSYYEQQRELLVTEIAQVGLPRTAFEMRSYSATTRRLRAEFP